MTQRAGAPSIDIELEFREIILALEAHHIDYAVVGGFAVAIWGAPRATTDIDLLVEPSSVEAIFAVARQRGFAFEGLPLTFRDGMELRRITRLEPNQMLTLDLLLVNANLRPAWDSRLTVQTGAGPVRVVSRAALLQMKVTAGRPQDLADIARLTEADR